MPPLSGGHAPPITEWRGRTSKSRRIIRLLNLLRDRKYVTLEDIKRTCGISSRSALRYIDDLSDADIAITYDKSAGGYRIDHKDDLSFRDFSNNDTVLLLAALDILARELGDTYIDEVESLVRRFQSQLSRGIGEIWNSFRHESDGADRPRTMAELVKSVFIHVSISKRRKLKVYVAGESTAPRAIEVVDPALRFNHEWRLEGLSASGPEAIRVSDIQKAVIV